MRRGLRVKSNNITRREKLSRELLQSLTEARSRKFGLLCLFNHTGTMTPSCVTEEVAVAQLMRHHLHSMATCFHAGSGSVPCSPVISASPKTVEWERRFSNASSTTGECSASFAGEEMPTSSFELTLDGQGSLGSLEGDHYGWFDELQDSAHGGSPQRSGRMGGRKDAEAKGVYDHEEFTMRLGLGSLPSSFRSLPSSQQEQSASTSSSSSLQQQHQHPLQHSQLHISDYRVLSLHSSESQNIASRSFACLDDAEDTSSNQRIKPCNVACAVPAFRIVMRYAPFPLCLLLRFFAMKLAHKHHYLSGVAYTERACGLSTK
jgi:hypothetical protein